jgi:hypothetical protein
VQVFPSIGLPFIPKLMSSSVLSNPACGRGLRYSQQNCVSSGM